MWTFPPAELTPWTATRGRLRVDRTRLRRVHRASQLRGLDRDAARTGGGKRAAPGASRALDVGLRHRQELHAAARPRLGGDRLRHLGLDGGAGAGENRRPGATRGRRHARAADPRQLRHRPLHRRRDQLPPLARGIDGDAARRRRQPGARRAADLRLQHDLRVPQLLRRTPRDRGRRRADDLGRPRRRPARSRATITKRASPSNRWRAGRPVAAELHRQRHHPEAEVRAAIDAAGLELAPSTATASTASRSSR